MLCWQGPLLLIHGLGRHDPSCAAWRRTTCDRFRARSVPGLLTRNCGLLRSVTAGEKRLVNAHGMGESAVRLLHRVPGTFPTLTTAQRLIAARLLPDAGNGIEAPGLWAPLPRVGSPAWVSGSAGQEGPGNALP